MISIRNLTRVCSLVWVFAAHQTAAEAADSDWIKEAIRDEIVFDITRYVRFDRATLRTTLLDDGWPRKRVKLGENATDLELRLARFPTETQAIKMLERLRSSTPVGGAVHPDWPAVADEVYDFNGRWMVARRRTVVIELFPDQRTDATILLESVRLVVAQIDKVQAELDRERTNESKQRATVHVEPKQSGASGPKPLVPVDVENRAGATRPATASPERSGSAIAWIIAAALFVGAILWIAKRRQTPRH
jgi:hypothetical protein